MTNINFDFLLLKSIIYTRGLFVYAIKKYTPGVLKLFDYNYKLMNKGLTCHRIKLWHSILEENKTT